MRLACASCRMLKHISSWSGFISIILCCRGLHAYLQYDWTLIFCRPTLSCADCARRMRLLTDLIGSFKMFNTVDFNRENVPCSADVLYNVLWGLMSSSCLCIASTTQFHAGGGCSHRRNILGPSSRFQSPIRWFDTRDPVRVRWHAVACDGKRLCQWVLCFACFFFPTATATSLRTR
jgi:hypothetical protein